jgi:hypothetical protein
VYLLCGLAGLGAAAAIDGRRGAGAAALGWAIAAIAFVRPPLKPRVAEVSVATRITPGRTLMLAAMPLRMLAVLAAAGVVFSRWGDHLGVGFWLAVLAFYLLALALATARTLTDLKHCR